MRKRSTAGSAIAEKFAVCLAGKKPAVVTETLYALAIRRRPRIVPSRVFIVTTADAKPELAATLLGPRGAIESLRRDYELPECTLECSIENVILLRDAGGRPLRDIRTSNDSVAAGLAIARFLSDLRSRQSAELHCSIAGGRKTMGALLALALQLLGKPGDRLYHAE